MKKLMMMKWAMLSICLLFFSGCDNKTTSGNDIESRTEKTTSIPADIGRVTVADLVNDPDYQIIDIREQFQYIGWNNGEITGGHISQAIDFSLSWVEQNAYQNQLAIELIRRGIDLNKKTVLYADDTVTEDIARKYQALGFIQLSVLEGGFKAYIAGNHPVEKLDGFSRYVHPAWLQDLIDGKEPQTYHNTKFIVAELGFNKDVYLAGHIKGAIQIDADTFNEIIGLRVLAEYEAIPLAEQLSYWDFPTDAEIRKNMEKYGITPDTTVVLYATDEATTAANRAVLVMDYAGVRDVRLLNGGKSLWTLENRPLEKGEVLATPITDFGVEVPQNPDIYINYKKERTLIDDPQAVIASIRSWPEYLGKTSGYTYIGVAGDIQGARFGYAGSDPYSMEDYRNLDNTMFNYKLIEARWKLWGITPDKYVSFHCGTGWRAAETYYIAEALGWKNIGVFVGGWYQWSKIPDSPTKPKGLPDDAPEQEPQEYFTVKK